MAFVNEMNVCELTPVPCAAWICGVVLVRPDDDDARVRRRLDHRQDEVVVADAVDDDRVEIDQLLDVLGPRLVVAGVDLARQNRPHLVSGQVADDVLRPRVVGVQRDADLQRARRLCRQRGSWRTERRPRSAARRRVRGPNASLHDGLVGRPGLGGTE